jgi:hypothetical protein
MEVRAMSSPNTYKMPQPLGMSIFWVLLAHSFCFLCAYFTLYTLREGAWFGVAFWAVMGLWIFRMQGPSECREDLYYSWKQRQAMLLTRQLKYLFSNALKEDVFYAAADVTQGHTLRVTRFDKYTLLHDPTGYYVFDDDRAVAWWAPTRDELDIFHPWVATAEQLQAIIKRVRSYR